MSRVCDLTGIKTVAGQNIQHHSSIKWLYRAPRTKRRFRPNLRSLVVLTDTGDEVKVNISMKAYKRLRKDGYFKVTNPAFKYRKVFYIKPTLPEDAE